MASEETIQDVQAELAHWQKKWDSAVEAHKQVYTGPAFDRDTSKELVRRVEEAYTRAQIDCDEGYAKVTELKARLQKLKAEFARLGKHR